MTDEIPREHAHSPTKDLLEEAWCYAWARALDRKWQELDDHSQKTAKTAFEQWFSVNYDE